MSTADPNESSTDLVDDTLTIPPLYVALYAYPKSQDDDLALNEVSCTLS
jgi:hypothetical protein